MRSRRDAAKRGAAFVFAVALASISTQAFAQARGLSSPVTGRRESAAEGNVGARAGTDDASSATTGSVPPSAPPPSYGAVEVPPAPTNGSVQYPAPDLSRTGPESGRIRLLAAETGVRIPSGIATRLRALDSDFQVLAARGGGSIVDGVIALLMGGLSITIGILVNDYGAGGRMGLSPYLYVFGGASVARGVLDLALMINPSGPAVTYAHMPMTSMEEVQARLEYGERELAGLADRARLQRILDGSLSIATALAIVPLYLAPNNFSLPDGDIFGIFVLVGAGLSAISGIIQLATTTEAERRWSAYEELRNRLEARGQESARNEFSLEASPVVAPITGGGMVGVAGRF